LDTKKTVNYIRKIKLMELLAPGHPFWALASDTFATIDCLIGISSAVRLKFKAHVVSTLRAISDIRGTPPS
jgi:hypothetical protein